MAKAPEAKDAKQLDLVDKIDLTAASEQTEIPSPPEEEVPESIDEPEVDDASTKLQEQFAALKKSEELHKNRADRAEQEAQKARQVAQERASEVATVRKSQTQSQLETVTTALKSAQEQAEAALRDIKTAINNNDADFQADAYKRLAQAEAKISHFEIGKADLEEKIKAPPEVEQSTQQQQPAMPARVQNWIDRNRHRLNQEIWDDLRAMHPKILREGHEFDSDGYLESVETRLGWREAAEEAAVPQRQPPSSVRNSIVSAPVSREAPSTPGGDRGGQVKLTPAQREGAKIAGVTEKVYAENLVKLTKMKANGSYGG